MSNWHKGPPPSVGWWPTRANERFAVGHLRWWSGFYWSVHVTGRESPSRRELNVWARTKSLFSNEEVEWTERPKSWPARSRT